jgi:threonine synthase
MTKLKGLKCRECGRHYPAAPVHVCEFCFGPLEVDYQYEALKGVVTRASIAAGPPSMWRYKDLLPIEGGVAVGHAVGFTPLIRANNLADELGCREIWIKNDSVCHPTWSFKDRVVAVAVTKAREFGFDTVACASTGNLANSVAAHAAEGRLKSYISSRARCWRRSCTTRRWSPSPARMTRSIACARRSPTSTGGRSST